MPPARPPPQIRAEEAVGIGPGAGSPGISRWLWAGTLRWPCQPPITPPRRANCLHHGKNGAATAATEIYLIFPSRIFHFAKKLTNLKFTKSVFLKTTENKC